MKKGLIAVVFMCIILVSCKSNTNGNLVYLQVVDRSGYTKTIDENESLKKYDTKDVKAPSTYEKMVKVFDKEDKGVITLYHENGLLWQYLETKKSRAHGIYEQYSPNGNIVVRSYVIEGIGDLTKDAKKTWVFDKTSYVYDEKKNVIAAISYKKGTQDGLAVYYYPNGDIKKSIPYVDGKIHGSEKGYDEASKLILLQSYDNGVKEGDAFSSKTEISGASEETYKDGKLITGKYYAIDGSFISEIKGGCGKKPFFVSGYLKRTKEYKNGVMEGMVTCFAKNGSSESTYNVKESKKDGEEIIYYPAQAYSESIKKLLINWRGGVIQGKVLSWYPNGVMESEKEMIDHKREGTHICWYLDSSLMMVEEYQKDKVLNGKYFRKGDNVPISRVIDGTGDAHIYDKDGMLVRKISYYNGNIIE